MCATGKWPPPKYGPPKCGGPPGPPPAKRAPPKCGRPPGPPPPKCAPPKCGGPPGPPPAKCAPPKCGGPPGPPPPKCAPPKCGGPPGPPPPKCAPPKCGGPPGPPPPKCAPPKCGGAACEGAGTTSIASVATARKEDEIATARRSTPCSRRCNSASPGSPAAGGAPRNSAGLILDINSSPTAPHPTHTRRPRRHGSSRLDHPGNVLFKYLTSP